MIHWFRSSFRRRLLAAFVAVSLIPLLLCSVMMLRVFTRQQEEREIDEAREYLDTVTGNIGALHRGLEEAGKHLNDDPLIAIALQGGTVSSVSVNNILYEASEKVRNFACCDLFDAEGKLRYSTRSTAHAEPLPVKRGILKLAAKTDGLVYSVTEDVTDTGDPLLLAAARVRKRDGETAGYFVAEMYQEDFRNMLSGKYGAQNELILVSRFWRPVYCARPALAAELTPLLREAVVRGTRPDGLPDGLAYSASQEENSGIYAILQRPQMFTADTIRRFRTISILALLLGSVTALILSLVLGNQLFRPVERLRNAMSRVTLDNLDVQVETGDDELGELAGRFNHMTAALTRNRAALMENQARLVQNQKDLNEAQIRMLQAQLNPHFLCNTLDTMKWMGKIRGSEEIAVMSTDLADILRFAISPQEFVTLDAETRILDRYIEIQRIRQSGALSFRLEIPEELEDCLVPKMMLQPLVENAVLHGLDGGEPGAITVRAEEVESSFLKLSVTDSGRGIPEEMTGPYVPPEGEAARHHLGLYNVDTILKKNYGEEFGLRLDNLPDGKGAVVTAVLPLRRKEENSL